MFSTLLLDINKNLIPPRIRAIRKALLCNTVAQCFFRALRAFCG